MKPTFHANPVNDPYDDPAVFVRILREKRALLFDLGDIGSLGLGHIQKITDIFVTHMHIDHFIGFDTVLRANLRRTVPLRVYGPDPIIGCVAGKLKGYTWNLIRDYPLRIEVFGISPGMLHHAGFHAENAFEQVDHPPVPFDGTLLQEVMFTVRGLVLSHQIPVVAYAMEEGCHINIHKAALDEMGLPVGPWLSDLKRAVREGAPGDSTFFVDGRSLALDALRRVVSISKGQKISYVMDVSPTEENIGRIISFVQGSDILFCEAYFLGRDSDRAMARHHLTAETAGWIARKAAVGSLEIMHFSPKYRDCPDDIYAEAERAFTGSAAEVR